MRFGRLALAAFVAWVVFLVIGFVVNTVLLADVMARNADAMRPEANVMANLPFGFAFGLVGFFVFAYAYAKGYEGGRGMVEGMRFGVIVGLLLVCFGVIWQYVVFPISGELLVYWILDYIVEFAIYGMIVGYLYKPAPVR